MFIEAGSLAKKEGAEITFTPLIETSDQAGDISAATLQFAQPDDITKARGAGFDAHVAKPPDPDKLGQILEP